MKHTPIATMALLSAMALMPLAGCVGGMNRQSGMTAAGVGQPAPPPSLAQRIGAAFQRTGEALTPKPRVIPAEDPLDLSSSPKNVNPDVAITLAQLFEQKGDYQNAIVQYNKALELEPQNLKALLGIARLHDRAEDFDTAISTYQRALEAHPNNAVILNDLGLCYARQGDVSRSLDALSKAVDGAPESKLYRNNLATILIERGLPDEALRHFVAASSEPVGNYNVGLLLYKKGEAARAVPYLRRAAELDPSLEAAHTLLARIQPNSNQQAGAGGYTQQAPTQSHAPRTATQPASWQTGASTPTTQHYAPIVSPSEVGVAATPASSPAAAQTPAAPQGPDVRMPQLGQYANFGEAQPPPQPDQYGGAFQPSAFPRQLPPVQ